MSNIDKRALAMTKELATLMVERFSMNPVSSKLLNEAWQKEFPDEVAIAKRMLALLDELEAEQRISSTWRKTAESNREKLEAAESGFPPLTVERLMREKDAIEKRVAELESREVKLPERYDIEICPTPSPDGEWYSREDILAALKKAGIRNCGGE